MAKDQHETSEPDSYPTEPQPVGEFLEEALVGEPDHEHTQGAEVKDRQSELADVRAHHHAQAEVVVTASNAGKLTPEDIEKMANASHYLQEVSDELGVQPKEQDDPSE